MEELALQRQIWREIERERKLNTFLPSMLMYLPGNSTINVRDNNFIKIVPQVQSALCLSSALDNENKHIIHTSSSITYVYYYSQTLHGPVLEVIFL